MSPWWSTLHILWFMDRVAGQSECQVNLLMNPYSGNNTRTNLGKTCQAWSAQYPRRHAVNKDEMFIDGSVEAAKNYCRKTKNTPLPWCFTTDFDLPFDFCDWMICFPPNRDCGGLLTESFGRIRSPDYNEDGYYDNWFECFWEIRVNESSFIEIIITTFDLQYDQFGCNKDYLEAWEPHARIFKLCAPNVKLLKLVYNTQYNVLFLHFYADEVTARYGFELSYEEKPALLCGGEARGLSGEIAPADLDGDGFYDDNLNCTWTIRAEYFHVLHVNISVTEIELTEDCTSDYLEVYQFVIGAGWYKHLLERVCGTNIEINVHSQNNLKLQFISDSGVNAPGFIARYNQTFDTSGCWQGIVNRQYRGDQQVTDRGMICQVWATQVPHEHTFSDIDFPIDGSIVDAENFCRDPALRGNPFCFTIDPELELDSCAGRICAGNPDCFYGFVTMAYSGNVSKTNHGYTCQAWDSQTPHRHEFNSDVFFNLDGKSISAASNYCRVLGGDIKPWCFTTDPNVQWDYCNFPICRGFDQECGGELRKRTGIISSPDHDGDGFYDPYTICLWTIHSGPNSLTEITVLQLDIFDTDDCLWDYVEIFTDGISIHRLCGSILPEPFLTTSPTIDVKFVVQGESQKYPGFTLRYKVMRVGDESEMISTSTDTPSTLPPSSSPPSTPTTTSTTTTVKDLIKTNTIANLPTSSKEPASTENVMEDSSTVSEERTSSGKNMDLSTSSGEPTSTENVVKQSTSSGYPTSTEDMKLSTNSRDPTSTESAIKLSTSAGSQTSTIDNIKLSTNAGEPTSSESVMNLSTRSGYLTSTIDNRKLSTSSGGPTKMLTSPETSQEGFQTSRSSLRNSEHPQTSTNVPGVSSASTKRQPLPTIFSIHSTDEERVAAMSTTPVVHDRTTVTMSVSPSVEINTNPGPTESTIPSSGMRTKLLETKLLMVVSTLLFIFAFL